jgi:hypothetical protein
MPRRERRAKKVLQARALDEVHQVEQDRAIAREGCRRPARPLPRARAHGVTSA